MTLSQSLRHITDRIDWKGPNVWISWNGSDECLFVRLTARYIHFTSGPTPDHPCFGYSLDREEWEECAGNGWTIIMAGIIARETLFCPRKVGDRFERWAAIIENGRKSLLPKRRKCNRCRCMASRKGTTRFGDELLCPGCWEALERTGKLLAVDCEAMTGATP